MLPFSLHSLLHLQVRCTQYAWLCFSVAVRGALISLFHSSTPPSLHDTPAFAPRIGALCRRGTCGQTRDASHDNRIRSLTVGAGGGVGGSFTTLVRAGLLS
jgi:hypothetical protein